MPVINNITYLLIPVINNLTYLLMPNEVWGSYKGTLIQQVAVF